MPAGSRRVGDEELLERRHRRPRRDPEAFGDDRHVAPRDDREALLADDALDRRLRLLRLHRIGRQERDADGVLTGRGKVDPLVAEDPAEEAVRDLDEDACAVAGVGLGTGGPAVLEVRERVEARADELVAGDALHVGDERHAARVVLEARVVETVPGRELPGHEVQRLFGDVARHTCRPVHGSR